ncbi:MAG: protoglobin domain-containing protein [Pseudomonadota bacterium]
MEQLLKDLQGLTGYSQNDAELLRQSAPVTRLWVDELAQAFYDTLYAYPPTQQILGEGQRAEREQTLRAWYLDVVSGEVTPRFWQRQWVVGLVHILRRVGNPYMLAMMSRAQTFFLGKCLEHWPDGRGEQVFGAFKRTTDVIAGLIAEGYFRNYVLAMERVAGFKLALIGRMMDLEVRKMLEEARSGA